MLGSWKSVRLSCSLPRAMKLEGASFSSLMVGVVVRVVLTSIVVLEGFGGSLLTSLLIAGLAREVLLAS